MKLYNERLKEVKFNDLDELQSKLNYEMKKRDKALWGVFSKHRIEILAEKIYINKDFIEFADNNQCTGRIKTKDIDRIYLGTIYPEIYLK